MFVGILSVNEGLVNRLVYWWKCISSDRRQLLSSKKFKNIFVKLLFNFIMFLSLLVWEFSSERFGRVHWVCWLRQCWTVLMKEGWRTDQPSYHPDPEPGLRFGPPPNPPYLWTIGPCEWDKPVDSNWQDLHNTGQQDAQEEPQEEPVISGIAETRSLPPNQLTHGNE